MYQEETFALTLKVAMLWSLLGRADLADVERVEDLAEKAQEIELAANALRSEFLGLAHFLEEVRR